MTDNRGLWRGKSAETKEWIEGYFAGYFLNERGENTPHILRSDNGDLEEVILETLGECTCVPDMKGKLIFEGDIVVGKLGYCGNSDIPIAEKKFVVKYWKGCYNELYCTDYYEFEIIGNIYDNPELLSAT